MITIQGVELVQRIRRAFGVRGSLNTPLDEQAVQVVKVFDATGAPFRSQGIRWWMNSSQVAPAGQVPMISVVADEPGSIVIDRVTAHITTATATLAIGWGTDAWFPPTGGQSSEVAGFDPTNPANIPVRLLVATVASPYAGPAPFFAHRITQFTPYEVNIDQPISQGIQGGPIITSLRILNLTAAGDLTVSVTGRYFPANP